VLGGVLDLYFLAGETPTEVSQQYAEVAGLPVMMPYWGFGLHQCRYGYRDFYAVAEVITNYSAAGIPLEVRVQAVIMFETLLLTFQTDHVDRH
jgi:alpha-glucosidase